MSFTLGNVLLFVEYEPADLGLFSGIDIRGSVFNISIALAKKAKRPRIK
jgi:hypothetical protein